MSDCRTIRALAKNHQVYQIEDHTLFLPSIFSIGQVSSRPWEESHYKAILTENKRYVSCQKEPSASALPHTILQKISMHHPYTKAMPPTNSSSAATETATRRKLILFHSRLAQAHFRKPILERERQIASAYRLLLQHDSHTRLWPLIAHISLGEWRWLTLPGRRSTNSGPRY